MSEMKTDKYKACLKTIFDTYGLELLDNVNRINALLMDYIPQKDKERKLIVAALREGVGGELLEVKSDNSAAQKACVTKCQRALVSDMWITESAAQFVVGVISYALGLAADSSENSLVEEKELIKGMYSGNGSDLATALSSYRVIGYKAFSANDKLISIEIPEGIIQIKSKSFLNCINLQKIALPSSIENIGVATFRGCCALKDIVIANNKRFSYANGLLMDKRKGELLRGTLSVQEKCAIPSNIVFIHAYAFERNQIRSITLPRQLKRLGTDAFLGCNELVNFEIDNRNEAFSVIDGVLHSKDRTTLILFPSGRKGANYIVEESVTAIADRAFRDAVDLESITFTNSLISIGRNAFKACLKLDSITLPGSVEVIGERAFQSCEKLTNIMLSRSIKEIGDCAFSGCVSVQTLSVPRNVERIGHFAFSGCKNLKRIILQDKVSFIGDGAFVGCSEILEISVNNNQYVKTYCKAHGIHCSEV